jgi:hypothetical protein
MKPAQQDNYIKKFAACRMQRNEPEMVTAQNGMVCRDKVTTAKKPYQTKGAKSERASGRGGRGRGRGRGTSLSKSLPGTLQVHNVSSSSEKDISNMLPRESKIQNAKEEFISVDKEGLKPSLEKVKKESNIQHSNEDVISVDKEGLKPSMKVEEEEEEEDFDNSFEIEVNNYFKEKAQKKSTPENTEKAEDVKKSTPVKTSTPKSKPTRQGKKSVVLKDYFLGEDEEYGKTTETDESHMQISTITPILRGIKIIV